MIIKKLFTIGGVGSLLLSPSYLQASSSETAELDVTAEVVAACNVSTSSVSFGDYSFEEVTAQGSIDVQCTNGTEYAIALDGGSSGDVANRHMEDGANTLNYALFSDSGFENSWGETEGTDTISDTGNGETQNHPVHGRIDADQTSPVGNYQDTVNVTVTF